MEEWCGVAQYGAPLACLLAAACLRRLAVRQAQLRFSARHHREVFPTERTKDEEMVESSANGD
jgi:hypothetical protein